MSAPLGETCGIRFPHGLISLGRSWARSPASTPAVQNSNLLSSDHLGIGVDYCSIARKLSGHGLGKDTC